MGSTGRRQTLTAQLDAMPKQYLECRLFGHAPLPHTADRDGGALEVVRRCACGSKKLYRLVERRGRVRRERAQYDYSEAPGYLLKGLGRPDKAEREIIDQAAVERLFG
jgi:hypothetical protein